MKKKAFWTGLGLSVLMLTAVGTGWAEGRISCRQAEQGRRIVAGVRYGRITPGEYDRLSREQCRIRQARRVAWADGCLGLRERRYLQHMQERGAKHIRRARQSGPACAVCRGFVERPCGLYGGDPCLTSGRVGIGTPLGALSTLSMHWSW